MEKSELFLATFCFVENLWLFCHGSDMNCHVSHFITILWFIAKISTSAKSNNFTY